MARREVVRSHAASHSDPISLEPGDRVAVGRRSEEWPAFMWCAGPDGREGWVPDTVLSPAGPHLATAVRTYEARELTVEAGEQVEVVEAVGGWSWCLTDGGSSGWLPDDVLGPERRRGAIAGLAGILVFTERARFEAMAHFYAATLGLTPRSSRPGFVSFAWGDVRLTVAIHDRVAGRTGEPFRMMLNLAVADIGAEHARLSAAGVAFLRPPEREAWGGWVATFSDPDGNLVQLLQLPQPSR